MSRWSDPFLRIALGLFVANAVLWATIHKPVVLALLGVVAWGFVIAWLWRCWRNAA
ncbi:MAG TPA: hypothetical protein VGH52_03560 [Gaiellaceae bacterium]|jgi:hypothetical protein